MRAFLAGLSILALAACGQPQDGEAEYDMDATSMDGREMADHAMPGHAMTDAEDAAPLPDDGVIPVVSVPVAWMRPHPEGRDVTAAYFFAMLEDGTADNLVAARIEGAERVELHGHVMAENGMMQMRPVGPQRIDSTLPLVFAPGGLHLMVFGLAPVAEGSRVEGVLVFERAGEIPVRFTVTATPLPMPMDH